MFNKLLALYPKLIIYPVKEITSEYYYFYKTNKAQDLFAISKKISKNEYELIKSSFVEKRIYTEIKDLQKIYDYLLENGNYPFGKKKYRFIIYHNIDNEIATEIIKEIIVNVKIIKLLDYQIAFYANEEDIDFQDLFRALSQDLSTTLHLHKGLIFDKEMKGTELMAYIYAYDKSTKLKEKEYSETPDIVFNLKYDNIVEIMNIFKTHLFNSILNDNHQVEMIRTFFENNLNVSLTAKLLYMHRNSLLNRLDNIYKETGFNIQLFAHASSLQLIMEFSNEEE